MNETNMLLWMIGGLVTGWLVGLISLMFFQDEIFNFMDRLVDRVRKALGLSV